MVKIPFNKTWLLLEKEDYANYLFVSITWEWYTWMPQSWGFVPGRFMGAEFIDSACNLFLEKSSFEAANKKHFEMLFTIPSAWDRLHKLTEVNARALLAFGKKVKKISPVRLTDRQLSDWIARFQKAQAEVHDPRGPMFLLETAKDNSLVSSYLQNYLRERYRVAKRPQFHPNEAFQILTTPLKKSIWTAERQALAAIALRKDRKTREQLLLRHAKKYEWLEYGLQGKILTFENFSAELKKMPKAEARKLLKHAEQVEKVRRQQKRIFEEYRIHPVTRRIFQIVQAAFYTRLLSKDSQFFGYYCMEPFFWEVGRRAGLTLEQVRFLHYREFAAAISGKKDFSKLTKDRQKYSLFVCDKGKTLSYDGLEAKKVRNRLKFFKSNYKVEWSGGLKGQPAFKGSAKGRVKIINTVQEMAKMHTGNILVSHMTNPGIVPAMKQAAAIVTDLGGITCHAAIVARELKKPCIIGTKHATQVLMDGDLVEVDANHGVVKKIS